MIDLQARTNPTEGTMEIEIPEVGQVVAVLIKGNRVRHATVVRRNADAIDWRKCSVCSRPFGYGPIGKHMVTGKLVCLIDCTP